MSSAYDFSKQGSAWGISPDALIDKTAQLNTSFSNNGYEEALQNRCLMKPGQNLPIWPKGLHTYTRPQLEKPSQQNINARIPLEFGRPFLPDEKPIDSGLFVPTSEMRAVPVNYPEGGILPPMIPPSPAPQMTAPEKKNASVAPLLNDDSQCALNNGKFSLGQLPQCSVKSMAALVNAFGHWKDVPGSSFFDKLGHAFMDNSRLFYLVVWIVLLLCCVLLVKVLFRGH